MAIPLELSFHHMNHSDSIEASVRDHLARLEHLSGRATSCHVVVDAPHHRKRKGRHYEVRVELRVPGDALVVSGNTGHGAEHEDLSVAMRDAFLATERQLKRWKEKRRGDVKRHESAANFPPDDGDRSEPELAADEDEQIAFDEIAAGELAAGEPDRIESGLASDEPDPG